MRTIHASVDVRASPRALFEAWSRFETFPEYMEGVERLSSYEADGTPITEWTLVVDGQSLTFQARVAEIIPDRRIAWTSTTEQPNHAGVVTFHRISDELSRVIVELDYEPSGPMQRFGDWLGVPRRLLKRNLERFKRWVEEGRTLADDPPPSSAAYESRPARGRLV